MSGPATESGSGARSIRRDRRAETDSLTRERTAGGREVGWRKQFRRARRQVGQGLLFAGAPRVADLLARTWRFEEIGRAHFDAVSGDGFLAGLWHGRMLPLGALHRRANFVVLVSSSRDGDIAEKLLHHLHLETIRGSSSRFGARSLREMRGLADAGRTVVITPDGPRGPRHSMNVGLAWLARATGMPILTAGVAVDRAWRLKGWDRFAIPKPRARVVVTYNEPVHVPRSCNDLELERITANLRDRLIESEREGFAHLGVPPDF